MTRKCQVIALVSLGRHEEALTALDKAQEVKLALKEH